MKSVDKSCLCGVGRICLGCGADEEGSVLRCVQRVLRREVGKWVDHITTRVYVGDKHIGYYGTNCVQRIRGRSRHQNHWFGRFCKTKAQQNDKICPVAIHAVRMCAIRATIQDNDKWATSTICRESCAEWWGTRGGLVFGARANTTNRKATKCVVLVIPGAFCDIDISKYNIVRTCIDIWCFLMR